MKKLRGPKKGTKFQGNHRYEFGMALARERIKRGLTQAELAERMVTTVRVVSHFEREVKNPPISTVKKLAKALNIPIDRLLFSESCNSSELLPLDRGLSKRFEIAQKLPLNARNEVRRLIDTLAKAHNII